MRFIENLKRKEKDNMRVPKTVQDAIPIKRIYTDGIFYLGNNKYSKTFKFTDINFAIAKKEEEKTQNQHEVTQTWCEEVEILERLQLLPNHLN